MHNYSMYETEPINYTINYTIHSPRGHPNRFKEVCQLYEINNTFASKLKQLEKFKIVIIADDSGSMNSKITSIHRDSSAQESYTRWDELKEMVKIIIDISTAIDHKSLDLHFLNRPGLLNVTDSEYLDEIFMAKPKGYTPIVNSFDKIMREFCDTNRLIILVTDGVPTDTNGHSNTPTFKKFLQCTRRSNDFVSIIACTDDKKTMKYLNNWDKDISNLDVCDDYYSERKEISRAMGSDFQFSFGDYVVKCLLGSIDPWFDTLDEMHLPKYFREKRKTKLCVLF